MLPFGIFVKALVYGSLAALNSLGFVLLWRTNRLVNLAQPSLGLVGGVLTGLLVRSANWSFWVAAPLGLAVGAILAFASDRLVLRRLHDAPRAVLLVATIGLAGIFGGIAAALPFMFGGPLPTYTLDLGFVLDIESGHVRLFGSHLLALAALPIALAGTSLFLYRTRLGVAALALGQDAERAKALGVPVQFVRSIVWVVAGLLATVSGILSIPVLGFNLGGALGSSVLLLALAPAVFAGFRSLVGAAVAALALSVASQTILWHSERAGFAQLMLGAAVLVAIAFQRRRLGRAEVASRASSWEAAATPRPLPWSVAAATRVRALGIAAALVAVAAAALVPSFLGPGHKVVYASSAAIALGALAVATAWIFGGEIALGHWGFAGLGAAVAAATPGPWTIRCLFATVAVGFAGFLLALASRRQSSLSFAVIGLAIATAAPITLLYVPRNFEAVQPGVIGPIAAVIGVVAAIALSRLRSTIAGARMIAARDDPGRAPWLGADPFQARLLALTISGALAGLAGGLYLAATPIGIAAIAFDTQRSLDLLSMAVIGGLGSPAGALIGAGAFQVARQVLPGPWSALAGGFGVLLVVIFRPAGLSRPLVLARDAAVAALTRRSRERSAGDGAAAVPSEQAVLS